MKARVLAYSLAALAALAAAFQHWIARRAREDFETETSRLVAESAKTRLLIEQTSRQVTALTAEREKRAAAANNKPSPTATPATPESKPAPLPSTPEVREMQVQASISDLRLRFAALLKQLGFTPEKLQTFDQIQADCVRILLDESQSNAARQQARQARDARLAELFGPAMEQWNEANRAQPARAVVAQMVQQTFQGSGALTTAQADQLTNLIGQNRVATTTGPAHYNWDRIVADASSILAAGQMADFAAAVQFRRASDEMSAIIAKKKP